MFQSGCKLNCINSSVANSSYEVLAIIAQIRKHADCHAKSAGNTPTQRRRNWMSAAPISRLLRRTNFMDPVAALRCNTSSIIRMPNLSLQPFRAIRSASGSAVSIGPNDGFSNANRMTISLRNPHRKHRNISLAAGQPSLWRRKSIWRSPNGGGSGPRLRLNGGCGTGAGLGRGAGGPSPSQLCCDRVLPSP